MMHPSDSQWWKTHSADYVLGLLSTSERLVFDRIMSTEPEIQALVVNWREKLQPMSDAIPPIKPPEHILPALIANIPLDTQEDYASEGYASDDYASQDHDATQDNPRTQYDSAIAGTATSGTATSGTAIAGTAIAGTAIAGTAMVVASSKAGTGNGHSDHREEYRADQHYDSQNAHTGLTDGAAIMQLVESKQKGIEAWRSFAGLATAGCLLMGIFGWMGVQQSRADKVEPTYDGISVVQNDDAQAMWIVDSSADAKKLRVTAVAPPALEEGQAFELWMVNPNEGGVVSMGLLPTRINASSLINTHRFSAEAESFSVSVESTGGSPESIPTGPLLYTGKIQVLAE